VVKRYLAHTAVDAAAAIRVDLIAVTQHIARLMLVITLLRYVASHNESAIKPTRTVTVRRNVLPPVEAHNRDHRKPAAPPTSKRAPG
jgi:hypothetical protein